MLTIKQIIKNSPFHRHFIVFPPIFQESFCQNGGSFKNINQNALSTVFFDIVFPL